MRYDEAGKGIEKMNRRIQWTGLLGILILLCGCSLNGPGKNGDGMENGYRRITQEQAAQMMTQEDGHLIVDVRRPEEYAEGHIPGAVNIPNETIGDEWPEALPDPDQILLVYCRSGNRSRQASEKLARLGYTNVFEFGGINTWTGEVITDDPEAKTEQEVQQNMKLMIDETEVPVTWEENASVEDLRTLLPVTIQMSRYGGFEQVGSLGQRIVQEDEEQTAKPGDIMLYSGDSMVVFFGSNAWAYTRLGQIDLSEKELRELLDRDAVSVTLTE